MNKDVFMMLEATNLHKTYRLPHKTVQVLKGASLAVEASERVAIMGRSGTGKSTLLHVLGGLDHPDVGEVRICGSAIGSLSALKCSRMRARQIGFVFQSYHLLPEMDVLENVMLPAMAIGCMSRAAMRKRAFDLLSRVGLADRATHTPLELSGGEQQRVALARALINSPSLLLADEPTGNLDRDTGLQILDLLFGLVDRHEHALVIVTHSPEVAARCDRVLHMHEGLLVSDPTEK